MKPLLAAKIEFDPKRPEILDAALTKISYPLIGSPKIDGIRVLCHSTMGPVTRKFKPVPNYCVRTVLSDPRLAFLDGEVTVGEPNVADTFNKTTRGVMSREGDPTFTYWVFDHYQDNDHPYYQRLQRLNNHVMYISPHPNVQLLESKVIENPEQFLEYEAHCLDRGFEGICVRSPLGRYKFNRSTVKEGILLKLKRILDDEAEVLRLEPRFRNDNEAQIDALGYTKRTSHKANKTSLEMTGRLIVKSPSFTDEFAVGSGFDHDTARHWFFNQDEIVGKTITFVYQPCGTIDKPRHPIFKGIRAD